MKASLIIAEGRVVTTVGYSQSPQVGKALGEVITLTRGYVLVQGERILAVTDNYDEAMAYCDAETSTIDATGKLVMPGYVDCHTHLSFAGWRDHELPLRLAGNSYLDILASGGGIISTVTKTRAATPAELLAKVRSSLDTMLLHGTTTVEAKSGYGLTLEDELKQLRVLREADGQHPVDIVRTFMGAHALPPEYAANRKGYIGSLVHDMLPQVAAERLAEFCDCFCENKAFTIEECRKVLLAAQKLGLGAKVHADEITPLGGALLAAELGAVSAEHLIHADSAHLVAMAAAKVIAVLLPATSFILQTPKRAPFKEMLALGVPVAISTDYNPGTSPLPSMQLLQSMACFHYGFTPAQAFAASTINAAHAIRRGEECGSLEACKLADITILNAPSLDFVPYHLGVNLVDKVIKRGKLVVSEGKCIYG
ncbi:MAG: imidazolonepropionase [Firmicutes bacterium]|nr:imidazolonepropionase [Dethiobacter sp.]MBS3887745.1 imidazolonepropionase [Bacillota bacterium]MBS4053908.1 imidazolonepropionase [Thermaerobacter sp.]